MDLPLGDNKSDRLLSSVRSMVQHLLPAAPLNVPTAPFFEALGPATDVFLKAQAQGSLSDPLSAAMAKIYQQVVAAATAEAMIVQENLYDGSPQSARFKERAVEGIEGRYMRIVDEQLNLLCLKAFQPAKNWEELEQLDPEPDVEYSDDKPTAPTVDSRSLYTKQLDKLTEKHRKMLEDIYFALGGAVPSQADLEYISAKTGLCFAQTRFYFEERGGPKWIDPIKTLMTIERDLREVP